MDRKCKEGSPAAILMKGHHKAPGGSSHKKEHYSDGGSSGFHFDSAKSAGEPIKRAAGGAGKARKGYPFT